MLAVMFFLQNYPSLLHVSVIVRESRAVSGDQGRPFAFIFSQCGGRPGGLTTMTFAKVGVRFS